MSTTFSELVQLSATLSGTSELRLAPKLRATLSGVGSVGANGVQTMGFVSGGVTYNSLYAVLSGTSELTATISSSRKLQATLSGTSSFTQGYGGVATLGAIGSLGGDTAYAAGYAELGGFTSEASDALPSPVYVSSINLLAPIASSGYMLVGTIASSTSTLGGFASLGGNKPYAGSLSVLPAIMSLGNNAETAVGVTLRGVSFLGDAMSASTEYFVEIADTLNSDDAIYLGRELLLDVLGTITTTGTIAAAGEYGVVMSELLQYIGALEQARTPIVWVVNTDSGANSTYRGWDFNSYMVWNGKNYAAGDDGLFELTGDTDDGTPISASILTGKSDLGTVQLKRMAYVYVAASADGGLSMIVHTDDGQTNEYAVTARELMNGSRTGVGKGLRSRFWQVELTNTDGGDFEIESIELMPDATIRRI